MEDSKKSIAFHKVEIVVVTKTSMVKDALVVQDLTDMVETEMTAVKQIILGEEIISNLDSMNR